MRTITESWKLGLCLLFVALLGLFVVTCGGDDADDAAEADATDTEMTVEEEPVGLDGDSDQAAALATLEDPDGNSVGTVELFDTGDGVRVVATLSGLSGDTTHGIHIHENGVCEGDFSSAGGHFNPSGTMHACPPDEPRHAGDMGNLTLANGGVVFEYTSSDLSLAVGDDSVIGKAIILHAGEDDCQSQPSGAAGDRLACGLIALAQPMASATIEVEADEGAESGDGY